MTSIKSKFAVWFSPRFLSWFRAFVIFFIIYTAGAVLLRYTLSYVIPFIIGLVIAMVSQPLIHFFNRKLRMHTGVSSWLSPLITIIALLSIIGGLGFLGVRELIGLVSKIPNIDPQNILNAIEKWLSNNSLPIALPVFDVNFINDNRDTILKALSQALSYAGTAAKWTISIITSLPTWIMLIVVIIFSSFSFTKDYDKLKTYTRSLFSDHLILTIQKTWTHGLVMLGKYIRSYLFIYFITFFQSYILFIILGIEYPLVWSLIVGVSDIIPILGPGTIYIPMAIVRIVSGDWVTGVILIGGWVFITIIRQFVESKVVADSINIHPLFMLAVLFIAFQSGSVYILIYLTFLLVFYNLLKQSGMMHTLFDAPMPKKVTKRLKKLNTQNKKKVVSQVKIPSENTDSTISGNVVPLEKPNSNESSDVVPPVNNHITDSKDKTS